MSEDSIKTVSGKFEFSRSYWPDLDKQDTAFIEGFGNQFEEAMESWAAETLIGDPPIMWMSHNNDVVEVTCGVWTVGGDTMCATAKIDDLVDSLIETYSFLKSKPQIDEAAEVARLLREQLENSISALGELELSISNARESHSAEGIQR